MSATPGMPDSFASSPRLSRRAVVLSAGAAALGLLTLMAGLGLPRIASDVRAFRQSAPASLVHLVREAQEVEPAIVEKIIRVGRGETIIELLLAGGMGRQEAHDAVEALRQLYNPRKLREGQEVTLRFGPGGEAGGRLESFVVPVNFRQDVEIQRADNGFVAAEIAKPAHFQTAFTGGAIESSLYESGIAQNIPASVMAEFFKLFSYDVDFQRELREGDRFEVMYDQYVNDAGELVHAGDITYAALVLSGKSRRVFRYEPTTGESDYFDETGESVRRALLRTPVDGARLTSRFGARQHPILGYTAMHRGVDFAAPAGTPVFASGHGTVAMAGANGGYGNYVRLNHTNALSTAYAHLSGIAKGIRKGARVRQGQVIGYVGSTGLSTGPHLHYEVLSGGSQINPLSVKTAAGRKLEGKELQRFQLRRAEIERVLQEAPPEKRIASR